MDTSFQTLVLNRLWQAVNVVGVERAFSLLALEHAQVIYAEDGSFRVFDGAGWFAFSKDLETGPGSRVSGWYIGSSLSQRSDELNHAG